MGNDRIRHRLRPASSLLCVALLAGLSLQAHAGGTDREHRLKGAFCNTEDQIDRVAAYMALHLSARAAVELVNEHSVVCSYVDLIDYVVGNPSMIGASGSVVRVYKYVATLTAVVVGNAVREVSPPARIFFVTPKAIVGVPVERGA